MPTLSLTLDQQVIEALNTVAKTRGRDSTELAADAVRRFVEQAQLRQFMQDPANAELLRELDEENIVMAEEGMAEYAEILRQADE